MTDYGLLFAFGQLRWVGQPGRGWLEVQAGVSADLAIKCRGTDVFVDRYVPIVELLDFVRDWVAGGKVGDFVFDESIEGRASGPAFRLQSSGEWSVGPVVQNELQACVVSGAALDAAVERFEHDLDGPFRELVGIGLDEWRRTRDPEGPEYFRRVT